MAGTQTDPVRCHAGASYPEHPTALLWEGKWLDVKQIVSESHMPKGKVWFVIADTGDYFMLAYEDDPGQWKIIPIPSMWDPTKQQNQE